MNRRTATLTLTKKLRDSGYKNKVYDDAVKAYLLNNAKSVVLDLESEGKLSDTTYSSPANYQFYHLRLQTDIALIGEMEERILREKYYKDVPDDVVRAFEVLNIPNFIKQYSAYSSVPEGDSLDKLISGQGFYRPFEKGDIVAVGDVIQGFTTKKYYFVEKVKSNGSIVGSRFRDSDLKKPFNETADFALFKR